MMAPLQGTTACPIGGSSRHWQRQRGRAPLLLLCVWAALLLSCQRRVFSMTATLDRLEGGDADAAQKVALGGRRSLGGSGVPAGGRGATPRVALEAAAPGWQSGSPRLATFDSDGAAAPSSSGSVKRWGAAMLRSGRSSSSMGGSSSRSSSTGGSSTTRSSGSSLSAISNAGGFAGSPSDRPEIFLFIGVLSGAGQEERRAAVREAWSNGAQQPGKVGCRPWGGRRWGWLALPRTAC